MRSTVYPLLLALLLGGCATAVRQPVLYPNAHYKAVGPSAARYDIEHCMQLASAAGLPETQAGQAGARAAEDAAVGAAAGGAWGAVRGDAGERAAAGAAAGAAASVVRSATRAAEPGPLFRRYVEHCLRERGYAVIGWQ